MLSVSVSFYCIFALISPEMPLSVVHVCYCVRSGLNSHYFHIVGDGHQPNSRGLYTHYKDFLLFPKKVGWRIPNDIGSWSTLAQAMWNTSATQNLNWRTFLQARSMVDMNRWQATRITCRKRWVFCLWALQGPKRVLRCPKVLIIWFYGDFFVAPRRQVCQTETALSR